MKKLILIGIFILFAFSVNAQDYYTAVGIRGGMSNGFSVKHFVSSVDAVEGIVAFRWGGFIVTGLYEYVHKFNEPGLSWYYGFGAHIGYWDGGRAENPNWWDAQHEGGLTIMGADGIIGMEYTFENVPINISLDWKPVFNLIGYSGLWGDMAAISIRYVIN